MQNQQLASSQSYNKSRSKSNLDQTVTLLCQKVYQQVRCFADAGSSIAKSEAELIRALRFREDNEDRQRIIELNERSLKADKATQAVCIEACQKLQQQLQSLGYQFRLIDSSKLKDKSFAPLLHVGRLEHRTPLSISLAFCDFCDQPATLSTKFHQLCQNHSRRQA